MIACPSLWTPPALLWPWVPSIITGEVLYPGQIPNLNPIPINGPAGLVTVHVSCTPSCTPTHIYRPSHLCKRTCKLLTGCPSPAYPHPPKHPPRHECLLLIPPPSRPPNSTQTYLPAAWPPYCRTSTPVVHCHHLKFVIHFIPFKVHMTRQQEPVRGP